MKLSLLQVLGLEPGTACDVPHTESLASTSVAWHCLWCSLDVTVSLCFYNASCLDDWMPRVATPATCVQVVGAVGWGGLQLDIPSTVEPTVTALIRRCWSEPALRPSFSELISIIKDMAHARGLHPAVSLSADIIQNLHPVARPHAP